MSDKAAFWREAAHHVVQNLGENADDTIAFEVAVAVVVLLEVIEVGVAGGEELPGGQAHSDRGLDLGRARQARGGMHVHVAVGAAQHDVKADDHLVVRGVGREHLIGAGGETLRQRGLPAAHKHPGRHDARVRVALEPHARGARERGLGARVEDHDVGTSAQRHRHEFVHRAAEDRGEPARVEPMPRQLGKRCGIGGEIDGWTLGHATRSSRRRTPVWSSRSRRSKRYGTRGCLRWTIKNRRTQRPEPHIPEGERRLPANSIPRRSQWPTLSIRRA